MKPAANFNFNKVFDSAKSGPKSCSLLKHFIRDPFIASVTPSSKFVADAICEQIDFSQVRNIIEFGPGNGAITRVLLSFMNPNSSLYAIDTSEDCINSLKSDFQDSRLHIIKGNAADASSLIQKKDFLADVIVSGIPFSLFSQELATKILKNTALMLRSNGTFIVYQTWIPPFITPARLKENMDPFFKIHSTQDVYKNFPPLRIISATPLRFRTRDNESVNDDQIINRNISVFELSNIQKRLHKETKQQSFTRSI